MEAKLDSTECLYVEKDAVSDLVTRTIREIPLADLAANHVRIKVEYSSLNYKDALCATGHPGVAKSLPIIPGIDAAGIVAMSNSATFKPGDGVMVFHAAFGTQVNGGLSRFVDVPADWVYPIPENLNARSTMAYGTAGFTAAQCIDELHKHQITPEKGPVIVTGATGGVGIFAVAMLSKLGYSVVASTGKRERYDWLREFGASEVIDRGGLNDETDRPLLSGKWSGAVDSVGGNTLATILRGTQPRGCVTACGLVGGANFGISVYPFILRGVTLQGIDTAGISREYRSAIWDRIANDWFIDGLENLICEVSLESVESKIQDILASRIAGRIVVKIDSK